MDYAPTLECTSARYSGPNFDISAQIPLAPFPALDELPDITHGVLAAFDRRPRNATMIVQALEQSVHCMERAVAQIVADSRAQSSRRSRGLPQL